MPRILKAICERCNFSFHKNLNFSVGQANSRAVRRENSIRRVLFGSNGLKQLLHRAAFQLFHQLIGQRTVLCALSPANSITRSSVRLETNIVEHCCDLKAALFSSNCESLMRHTAGTVNLGRQAAFVLFELEIVCETSAVRHAAL